MTDYKRPSWDEYFMGFVDAASKRATCDRGRTASVIVKNQQILTTGYVGSPPDIDHCDDVGHLMKKHMHADGSVSEHCERTTHAEVNAIAQAARHGIALEGSTLYCKLEPCFNCAKMITTVGIERVIAQKKYHRAEESRELFQKAGIELIILNDTIEQYDNQ